MPFRSPRDLNAARWFRGLTAALIIALLIPLVWSVGSASPRTDVTPKTRAESKFQFARIKYPGGMPGYLKNWYTDYPAMDNHLTALLRRLTRLNAAPPVLVSPSSQDIFNYPLVYTVEPEQMVLGQDDAANLCEYLKRGGFWFADDFHGDEEFDRFLAPLQRVFPEAVPVELDISRPLFHCFYDIDRIIQVTNDGIAKCEKCDQWKNGPFGKDAKVFAVFDEHGRISVLLAWNTDLGDGLQLADDRTFPSAYSVYSFKFMTNVLVYAMTH